MTTKIVETRFYNGARGYQVNFVKNENDVGIWYSVVVIDDYGTTSESNRNWLDRYYPEIHKDVIEDPVENWKW